MGAHTLRVAAAAVVDRGRLLVVSKHAAPGLFYLPGGKPDPGEDDETALRRELDEELGVALADVVPYAVLHGTADLERRPMELVVFRARLVGAPAIAAELAALHWWTAADPRPLASVIGGQVVPRLTADGLLAA